MSVTEQMRKNPMAKWCRPFQWCQAIFFYSPASRAQTIEDCLVLRRNGYKWYPPYCDRLLQKFGMMPVSTPHPGPKVTIGWGWTEWGAWSDGCPESCGRRCQIRYINFKLSLGKNLEHLNGTWIFLVKL